MSGNEEGGTKCCNVTATLCLPDVIRNATGNTYNGTGEGEGGVCVVCRCGPKRCKSAVRWGVVRGGMAAGKPRAQGGWEKVACKE